MDYKYKLFVTLDKPGIIPDLVVEFEINTNVQPDTLANCVNTVLTCIENVTGLMSED